MKNSPNNALPLINTLALDSDLEVLIAFIEHLPILLRCNAALGFQYLERFSRNNNRYIRHAVVRILHKIIANIIKYRFSQPTLSNQQELDDPIFTILLQVALNEESEWTQQEASRTLAFYLDLQDDKLIVALYTLIIKNIQAPLLRHMANNATTGVVKRTVDAFASLIAPDLCLENVQECLKKMVMALEEVKSFEWGTQCWVIYKQLQQIFAMQTIDEIANFTTFFVPELQYLPNQQPFRDVKIVFQRLVLIRRILRTYIRRDGLNDRMSSLLEASEAIDKMRKVIDEVYNQSFVEEPMTLLPDRRLCHMLLDHWNTLIQETLSSLRGKPELLLELQTRCIHFENPFGIWLQVRNIGRSTAHNVHINLRNSDTEMFTIIE